MPFHDRVCSTYQTLKYKICQFKKGLQDLEFSVHPNKLEIQEAVAQFSSKEDFPFSSKLAPCPLVHLDQLPAFLTSDDVIRSNEIIRTKWPIY